MAMSLNLTRMDYDISYQRYPIQYFDDQVSPKYVTFADEAETLFQYHGSSGEEPEACKHHNM